MRIYHPGFILPFTGPTFEVNTTDRDDLTRKLIWCEVELEKTPQADSDKRQWLTDMVYWLRRLIDTLPEGS